MKSLEELLQERKILDSQIAEMKKINIEEKRIKVNRKLLSFTEEQKEFLLGLFEHERTSCSNEEVYNGLYSASGGGWRCNKCMLIEILRGDHGSDYDFTLDVHFWRTEDI